MPREDPDKKSQNSVLEASGIPGTRERTPTLLLLDTSHSMGGETNTPQGERKKKIEQLNEGLRTFQEEVSDKEHAEKRVDVAIVTFGSSATVEQDFTPFQNWNPPTLDHSGKTSMGEAIQKGIDLVEQRKDSYKQEAVAYNRPLIWLLTDGKPTDMKPGGSTWKTVQDKLDENKAFEFFAMGVGGADMDVLNQLVEPTNKPALKIKEGMFEEYFKFLSNSLDTASDPDSGDNVEFDTEHLQQFAQYANK